ncbi:MAG: AAA family ATPase [Gammaproteobacteria bacterium]|nr:AAA family ATPase [Gammaproteobacteria bacterium]
MKNITKIKLENFKRFRSFSVPLYEDLNVIVGENEAGKSSILSAVHYVLGGNRNKIESIGFEKLINTQAVKDFLASEKKYEDLPKLCVELYLNEQNNIDLNGKNNSDDVECDGLKMECIPNDDLGKEIKEILEQDEASFPFEYYMVRFSTFQGDGYSGYKKYIRHILVDNTLVSNEYSAREYVSDMYSTYVEGSEKNKHQHEYRKAKETIKDNVLKELNDRIDDYSFALKHDSKANLMTDLTLTQDGIGIESKGKGTQCFIKTEFALKKADDGSSNGIDVALIEEPENHLSHINMKKLINKIAASDDKQLIIATHSNLVSARLDLRKTILLHSSSDTPALMQDLTEETAAFFMKAPDHRILDFVLSKKTILVEGDAEFILMEAFFKNVTGGELENSDVHVLSVDGTSFKRYLEIAKLLNIKTAVIRDNDGDYQVNCVDNYVDYVGDDIKVFSDEDNNRSTFEICLYQDNSEFCDGLFAAGRRTLSVGDYMLKNKTESAFNILVNIGDEFVVPEYMKDAIGWIKD